MAIQKEIWSGDIVDNLYANNAFAQHCYNADQHVLGGAVVHIPVAGAATNVKKNLTVFPQVATERADTDITYALDTFYALPRRVANLDKYELAYDKRNSVVGEDNKKLIQQTMQGLLYNWAPFGAGNTNIILTEGAASADDLIDGTATGTRKLFTKAAFKTAAKKVDNADYEGYTKIALLTANHYHQFFESLSDAEKTNFNNVADLAKGIVGEYMGWTIMKRSSVLRYRKSPGGIWTPVDMQLDAYAADPADCAASLFYIDIAVERALGTVDVFDNPGQALYYGDVYSAMLRMGGRIRRQSGVYAVVEDNT